MQCVTILDVLDGVPENNQQQLALQFRILID